MADALEQVLTRFGFQFDAGKFNAIQRGVNRASRNLTTIARQTDRFQQRMGGFFQRAKQVVGAYLGFRAVKLITSDYAKGADAVAKFSQATGVSTDFLQQFNHAVRLGGGTREDAEKGIKRLTKVVFDAGNGLKTAQRAFGALGLDHRNIKADEEGMLKIADAFANAKDQGKAAAAAQDLFGGRVALKLIPSLRKGRQGMQEMMQQARELGIVLSGKQLRDAEKFNDEMLRAKSVFIGIRNIIASRLLPVLTRAARAFQLWWREGRNAERALQVLKVTAILTGFVIGTLITARVLRNVAMFTRFVWASVTALRAQNVQSAIALGKFLLIAAAIAFIALVIEDLVRFARGEESLIGKILGKSKLADDLRKSLISIGRAAVQAWKRLKPALKEAWEATLPALRELNKALEPISKETFIMSVHALVISIKLLAGMITTAANATTFFTQMFTGSMELIRSSLSQLREWGKTISDEMGLDFAAAGAIIETAWNQVTGRIRETFNTILAKGRSVLSLVERIGGKRFARLLGISTAGLAAPGPAPAAAPVPALPGGVGGAAAAAITTQRVAVAPGAVQVTVRASGDPNQIATIAEAAVKRGIAKTFTDASRDLVKPPRGQT